MNLIINPKTGKKYSIFSKQGKIILFNYLQHLNGGATKEDSSSESNITKNYICRLNIDSKKKSKCDKVEERKCELEGRNRFYYTKGDKQYEALLKQRGLNIKKVKCYTRPECVQSCGIQKTFSTKHMFDMYNKTKSLKDGSFKEFYKKIDPRKQFNLQTLLKLYNIRNLINTKVYQEKKINRRPTVGDTVQLEDDPSVIGIIVEDDKDSRPYKIEVDDEIITNPEDDAGGEYFTEEQVIIRFRPTVGDTVQLVDDTSVIGVIVQDDKDSRPYKIEVNGKRIEKDYSLADLIHISLSNNMIDKNMIENINKPDSYPILRLMIQKGLDIHTLPPNSIYKMFKNQEEFLKLQKKYIWKLKHYDFGCLLHNKKEKALLINNNKDVELYDDNNKIIKTFKINPKTTSYVQLKQRYNINIKKENNLLIKKIKELNGKKYKVNYAKIVHIYKEQWRKSEDTTERFSKKEINDFILKLKYPFDEHSSIIIKKLYNKKEFLEEIKNDEIKIKKLEKKLEIKLIPEVVFVTGTQDGYLEFYHPSNKQPLLLSLKLYDDDDEISSITKCDNYLIVTCKNEFKVLDLNNGLEEIYKKKLDSNITSLICQKVNMNLENNDSKDIVEETSSKTKNETVTIICSLDNGKIVSVNENNTTEWKDTHKGKINKILKLQDGSLVSCADNDSTLKFWNPNNGELYETIYMNKLKESDRFHERVTNIKDLYIINGFLFVDTTEGIFILHSKNALELYIQEYVKSKDTFMLKNIEKSIFKYDLLNKSDIIEESEKGNIYNVKLLIKLGIDVNKADDYGYTPLIYLAIEGQHQEIVEILLKHKDIDVNKTNVDDGTTPLILAAYNGHKKMVEMLLKHKDIDVNKADNDGKTPLHIVVNEEYRVEIVEIVEIVEMLLKHKDIDVNKADNDGKTPLILAAYNGHKKMVEMLLKHKDIDVNKTNDDNGNTPLHIAFIKNNKEIIQMLLNHKDIDVNKANEDGKTYLQVDVDTDEEDDDDNW